MRSRTFTKSDREYMKLQTLADMMSMESPNGYKYNVVDCYLDFGANMVWTTICYDNEWGGVQVLSPREWEEIICSDSVMDIYNCYQRIRQGEYWGDK